MRWLLLDSGARPGAWNMEQDIRLTESCSHDVAIVRFYRWQPYCISLGKHQPIESVDTRKAEHDGIDVVFRPTGGRAVLHAEELTYSVIMKTGFDNPPQTIYRQINEALRHGLTLYHGILGMAELEQMQADFTKAYAASSGFACFATSAKNELKFQHRKLIGSAQRKLGDVILQHGSILCGDFHRNIVHYLRIPEKDMLIVQEELLQKTVSIAEVIGETVDYVRLASCLKNGFQDYFSMIFEDTGLPEHAGALV